MRVLLSIKPEFAEKILTGEKKFEFRRVIHSNKNVHTVVIYMTAPVQRMVGEFEIDGIIENDPDTIWKNTSHSAGISRKKYDDYFAGRARGYAIGIGRVVKYLSPIDPRTIIPLFSPPQSFMYFPSSHSTDRNKDIQQLNFDYL